MKYQVVNLRNGVVAVYDDLDMIDSYIKISVKFHNERKKEEKRLSKKNFEIIELFQLD